MLSESLTQSLQQIGLPYFIIWAILMIVTDVLTIMYLGPSWESTEVVIPNTDKSMTGETNSTTPGATTPVAKTFGATTPEVKTQVTSAPISGRAMNVPSSTSYSLVSAIDPTDWRRKWILSFAWLKLVMFALMIFLSIGTITLVPMFNILLAIWIFYNVMVVLALGPTFAYDEDKPYYIDEWKRKFILLVCWFSIAVVAISFISYLSPLDYSY